MWKYRYRRVNSSEGKKIIDDSKTMRRTQRHHIRRRHKHDGFLTPFTTKTTMYIIKT